MLGSQSDSDSLASEEGVNDDNTDDELSKVVGGLEFAIDRQNTDSKHEEKKGTTENKLQEEEKKPTEDDKKPSHSLQSVSTVLLLQSSAFYAQKSNSPSFNYSTSGIV